MEKTINNITGTIKNFFTLQFLKFLLVGVSNTVVTWLVFTGLRAFTPAPLFIANSIGYIAGLCNSFLWNKIWVFKSKHKSVREVVLFVLVFGICYAVQWTVLKVGIYYGTQWAVAKGMTSLVDVVEQIAFLCSMAVYTPLNYLGNKYVTFQVRKKESE